LNLRPSVMSPTPRVCVRLRSSALVARMTCSHRDSRALCHALHLHSWESVDLWRHDKGGDKAPTIIVMAAKPREGLGGTMPRWRQQLSTSSRRPCSCLPPIGRTSPRTSSPVLMRTPPMRRRLMNPGAGRRLAGPGWSRPARRSSSPGTTSRSASPSAVRHHRAIESAAPAPSARRGRSRSGMELVRGAGARTRRPLQGRGSDDDRGRTGPAQAHRSCTTTKGRWSSGGRQRLDSLTPSGTG
jgi:hypothetical protein